MVLFFHRLSAGSFLYLNDSGGIFVNLNVKGELMISVLSGYMFFLCFDSNCILSF